MFQVLNTLIIYGSSTGLHSLGALIPSLAVSLYHLHDMGRSSWWLLIGLIPIVSWTLLIIWYCQKEDETENRCGSNSGSMGAEFIEGANAWKGELHRNFHKDGKIGVSNTCEYGKL